MGKQEIERFLSHLAINRDVSASTQNQALNAILFLYKHVLKLPVDMNIRAIRSKKPKRLPTVLSRQEIQEILNNLSGTKLLMVKLMYAAGTLIFVSHDREFVSSLATRIIELTPKGVVDFKGSYDEYLHSQGIELNKLQAVQ